MAKSSPSKKLYGNIIRVTNELIVRILLGC